MSFKVLNTGMYMEIANSEETFKFIYRCEVSSPPECLTHSGGPLAPFSTFYRAFIFSQFTAIDIFSLNNVVEW